MKLEFKNYDGIDYISAMELQKELQSTGAFSIWIKRSIKRAYLEIVKDFVSLVKESSGGRQATDYLLTIESAKRISIIANTKKSKEIIDYLIELDNQHNTGLAFTNEQFESLIDLSKSMTLISVQKEVEGQHYALYNDKYTWYEYRAGILRYSTKDLIAAMQKVNKIHKSARKSLIQLDAIELIRVGVIDLMMALGKTSEYSTNVGNLCKAIASRFEYGNIIWDDTKDNPLKINQSEVEKRQLLYKSFNKKILDK